MNDWKRELKREEKRKKIKEIKDLRKEEIEKFKVAEEKIERDKERPNLLRRLIKK